MYVGTSKNLLKTSIQCKFPMNVVRGQTDVERQNILAVQERRVDAIEKK